MTSHPTPTRADVLKFCEVEGWTLVRDARGRAVGHHQTFQLQLPDGRVLRTRISQPPDRSDIGASLFSHILREQLDVTAEQFWRVVNEGIPPRRAEPDPQPPETIEFELIQVLLRRVGLTEPKVRAMSRAQIIDRVNQYWTTGQ